MYRRATVPTSERGSRGTAAAMALTGGWVFFIARVVYVPLYLAGIPVLRTLAWGAGWVGLVMMLIPLLDRA